MKSKKKIIRLKFFLVKFRPNDEECTSKITSRPGQVYLPGVLACPSAIQILIHVRKQQVYYIHHLVHDRMRKREKKDPTSQAQTSVTILTITIFSIFFADRDPMLHAVWQCSAALLHAVDVIRAVYSTTKRSPSFELALSVGDYLPDSDKLGDDGTMLDTLCPHFFHPHIHPI